MRNLLPHAHEVPAHSRPLTSFVLFPFPLLQYDKTHIERIDGYLRYYTEQFFNHADNAKLKVKQKTNLAEERIRWLSARKGADARASSIWEIMLVCVCMRF